ncbi:copper resistance protein CopC [Sphaerisporangium sp. TRM90804]|uniref:copper resistance CopC family protein n=1 Tax=Sphaerisporangium sp. TRM90804 TaxID=3031113 RepID=UPI002449498F|nr:copper resistance protein CopC [Sphaerisporangium sp. TRM90804]MDH2424373.1 copper resistance protein CopC [Sphaerisporangium sp. TRM90804]
MPVRRLLTVLLVACAAMATAVAPAQAHNVLTGSDPKEGARLGAVPGRVTLTFDQPVRAEFAQVALTHPGGGAVRVHDVRVSGAKVRAALPADGGPGVYVVGYQILSNDGHPVTGKITFTVAAKEGAGAPAETASPTTPATPAETGPATAAQPGAPPAGPPPQVPVSALPPPGGDGAWVWGLLVVALLLSGLGILVVARQGRPRRGAGA